QRLTGLPALSRREKASLRWVIAAAAVALYPLSLGWGNWDFYRTGWGSFGLLGALLVLALFSWARGLRLLPLLIGLSLLAWSAGLMESANLWDYLLDPWLAVAAFCQCAKAGAEYVWNRCRPTRPDAGGHVSP
ncbi:MAG: hypothetical protein ABIR35_07080, partial [Polaromonas sp.]